jgi:hypothetical protein
MARTSLLGALRRGLVVELLFQRRHFRQGRGVGGDLRDGDAGVLHRQPHHRDHVGDDQDDVLGHLGPGHRLHAAEEGAHQDAGEADEHADAELQAGEAAGDDADAVDLRDHVGERAGDGDDDADEARDVAAVTGAEEVRNRELAELAQVGREEQRHQAVAAGPAHDEGEAVEAGVVERAGHADEGGGRHPVGAGRHAVEERRHAASRDVVFRHFRRLRHEADAGVEQDGGEEEQVAEHLVRHAELFEDADDDDEGDEAARVEGVVLLQVGVELRIGIVWDILVFLPFLDAVLVVQLVHGLGVEHDDDHVDRQRALGANQKPSGPMKVIEFSSRENHPVTNVKKNQITNRMLVILRFLAPVLLVFFGKLHGSDSSLF